MEENEQPKKKVYPVDTTEGFQYLDESEETMGIETKTHDNGNLVKRVTLSGGRKGVLHELKAWEIEKEAPKLHDNQKDMIEFAFATLALKIDDQKVVIEDLQNMKAKDWNKIKYANALINFM